MSLFELHEGDCREVMAGMEAESVDTLICDPPYGLSFMGKDWDHGVPGERFWVEALRVAKPGAHLLAFGGTRTHHRLMVAIEDAGWVIRDVVMYVYGSGFPKSHNISKAIDKVNGESGRMLKFVNWMRTTGLKQKEINAAIGKSDVGSHYLRRDQPAIPTAAIWSTLRPLCGNVPAWVDELIERVEAEREVVGQQTKGSSPLPNNHDGRWNDGQQDGTFDITAPATDAAREWDGYGTALKPAWEPVIVAMKPLAGTFAQNALQHGVAGLNIDGGRVGTEEMLGRPQTDQHFFSGLANNGWNDNSTGKGRFPANLIHDGSDEVLAGFPVTGKSGVAVRRNGNAGRGSFPVKIAEGSDDVGYADSGSAARFFYTAKASRSERNAGLPEGETSSHPTVKPLALMRYLCKLTRTPTGGVVLDPFMGSGSTGCAAVLEGRRFIGIDLEPEYVEIARRRIEHWSQQVEKQMELEL